MARYLNDESHEILNREQLRVVFTTFLNSKKGAGKHRTLWQTYFERVTSEKMLVHGGDVNYIFNKMAPSLWISETFDWTNSPENYHFWDNIDDEWLDVVNRN